MTLRGQPDLHARSATTSDAPPASEGRYRATLADAALPDLIQWKCMGQADEVVEVQSGTHAGTIHFRRGNVHHASCGQLQGDAALLEMLRWPGGHVRPGRGPLAAVANVQSSWQGLLLRAAQLQDESRRDTHPSVDVSSLRDAMAGRVVPLPGLSRSASAAQPLTPIQDFVPEEYLDIVEISHDAGVPHMTFEQQTVTAALRLDAQGEPLETVGDGEDLAPVAAYGRRIAELLGEMLGLEPLQAVEAEGSQASLFLYGGPHGEQVAVLTERGSAQQFFRKRIRA